MNNGNSQLCCLCTVAVKTTIPNHWFLLLTEVIHCEWNEQFALNVLYIISGNEKQSTVYAHPPPPRHLMSPHVFKGSWLSYSQFCIPCAIYDVDHFSLASLLRDIQLELRGIVSLKISIISFQWSVIMRKELNSTQEQILFRISYIWKIL